MPITRQPYFLPTQISNCSLWLDAADTSTDSMILSGSNVSTWKDKSGTGNNATANTGTVTTNSTRINGLNTIRFNTSSFLNIASFTMTANISAFAVLRGVTAQETGPKGYFFLGNGAQPSFFVYTLPPANGNLAGPFSGWVATTGETNWYMPSSDFFLNNPGFIYTDNNSSFVNGSQLTFNPNRASVPNAVSAGTYGIQVGGRVQADSLAFDFAECIFYNRTITATQRQQVEGYLAQKWGLTGSLPAGHPGLTSLLYRVQQPFLGKIPYFTRFSPRQIGGCILWLDAADSATTTSITSGVWVDKSGGGFNTSYVAGGTGLTMGSINRIPAVTFPGGDNNAINSSAATSTTNGFSIFFVASRSNSSPTGARFITNTSSSLQIYGIAPDIISTYVNNLFSSTSLTIVSGVPFIFSLVVSPSTFSQWVNGTVNSSTGTTGFAAGSTIVIGASGTSYTSPFVFAGQMGEILVFNSAITTTQRQQVESYLAQKWGLTLSLVAGHLNATFPAGAPTAIQPYVASVLLSNVRKIGYPTGTPTVNNPTNTTTTLNLSWNAPTFTTTWSARQITQVLIISYTVYILADGTLAATLTPGNVLSTTFSPMTAGVAYSYFVRANGPAGQSASSATSSSVTYILPPGSPTVNTPTNTVTTLNMTWNAPVGGGQVTSYTVYVLAAGSLVSTLTPGFVLSTTFSPMTGDVAYSFYVSATGPGGTSAVSSTSATVTYSAGPMSYLTGVSIFRSTNTINWTNNWKPYLNAVFSCNSVSNITTTFNKIGISNWAANHWQLGVAHPNSNIYFSPYNAANILCYNPFTNTQTFITGGPNSTATFTGSAKWNQGCLSPDGTIYFFPWTAATILALNPTTNDTCNISLAGRGGTYTSSGYRNSIYARDGRIYLSPYGATSIFWFDPSNLSTGNITSAAGVNLPGSSVRWEGTSLGADGNIYMNPLTGAQPVLRLNLSNYSTTTVSAGLTAGQTYRGAATLAVNDALYFAPAQANAGILYVNSNLTTGIIANTTALVYRDSFYGPDGKIYIMPNNGSSNVMVVNPSNNTVTNSNNSLTIVNIQGAVMGLDGNIYGGTQSQSNILQVVFNNVKYKFDSNYILSPYVNHH